MLKLIMESLLLVALLAALQIVVMAYVFMKMMNRITDEVRMMEIFKKSRTIQDIAALKSLGIDSDEWEEKEVEEEEDDGLMATDQLSEEALSNIAKSDGT